MWPGLSMSFLKICLLCQNLLIFTNILIMILLRETASLGHIIHYCITLRPNTHSQLKTLRPIFHSHHTPTKLTYNHSNPWPKSMESFKSASREEVVQHVGRASTRPRQLKLRALSPHHKKKFLPPRKKKKGTISVVNDPKFYIKKYMNFFK